MNVYREADVHVCTGILFYNPQCVAQVRWGCGDALKLLYVIQKLASINNICIDNSFLFVFSFLFCITIYFFLKSLIAQLAKNPPAMQEMPVQLLGQEDPLEKG